MIKSKILYLGILVLASVSLVACSHYNSQTTANNQSNRPTHAKSESKSMKTYRIIVTIDGHDYQATLNDSTATQSLVKRLPLELTFRDYVAGVDEKIADLSRGLDYGNDQYDHDPEALDIGYWSPDKRLVFYYGDVGEYDGIHVLGKFEPEAKAAIQNLKANTKVSIRLAN